jgi:hypothetical protein
MNMTGSEESRYPSERQGHAEIRNRCEAIDSNAVRGAAEGMPSTLAVARGDAHGAAGAAVV